MTRVGRKKIFFNARYHFDVPFCLDGQHRGQGFDGGITLEAKPASDCRPCMFWPIIKSGMRRIWIMFEMNSQKTKPIGGSNCRRGGASKFHPSQKIVTPRIRRKNVIVPTCSVIQIASF